MNVTMNPDIYERLWSCLRTDFNKTITVYLANAAWGYETLGSVAREHHVTAYYNWIGVKQGRIDQVYTEHCEAVIKLIIKTAKEIWLPPFPSQTLRRRSTSEDFFLDRNVPMDRMNMKRQIGGLFLLWLVYQNQPRSCKDRFPIELSLDDVLAIEKFEANVRNFSAGLRGEVVVGLRCQIMTILTFLRASGSVNVVISTDTFGTDEIKMLRNYLQTRKKLAEFGEIDSNKSWRENFLFGRGFTDVVSSLGETFHGLETLQKKLMLNGRIVQACRQPVIAARKLATREERYDYFKKSMIRVINEKKHSLNHPYMKTIFQIFDKVITEAPTARSLKARNGTALQQPKAVPKKSEASGDKEMESSDEDFDNVAIPGELKTLPDKDNTSPPPLPKKKHSSRHQFLESIDDFDCKFLDALNDSNSKQTTFQRKEMSSTTAQKPSPLVVNANGSSSQFGSQERTNSDMKPTFWSKMNTEEKKEWVAKFKKNMKDTLKAKNIVTKITADIEGLAKLTISADTTDIISKETLAAEAKRLRNEPEAHRKSRAKPKPDLILRDSTEALEPLLDALRIEGEDREKVVDQFREIHSKPTEFITEPEQHKKCLGKYMELIPLTSEKAMNTDPGTTSQSK